MYNKFEADGIKEKILAQTNIEKRILLKHLESLGIVNDIADFILKKQAYRK
jgi:hypothetical protein